MEQRQKTRTGKSWSERDTATIEFHSQGRKAKEACVTLNEILVDRTPAAILGKIYEVQAVERNKALKMLRDSESQVKQSNMVELEELLVLGAIDVTRPKAVNERIADLMNDEYREDIEIQELISSEKTSTHRFVLINGQMAMSVVDGKSIISEGSMSDGFHESVSSDFEIEGTFTIRKINKLVSIEN